MNSKSSPHDVFSTADWEMKQLVKAVYEKLTTFSESQQGQTNLGSAAARRVLARELACTITARPGLDNVTRDRR